MGVAFLFLFSSHQLLVIHIVLNRLIDVFICDKSNNTTSAIKTDRFYDKVKVGVEGLMSLTGLADRSADPPRCFVNFNQDFT